MPRVNFTMVEGDDGKKHHKPGPGSRGQDDNKNHFADLDMEYKNGQTFLNMNDADPGTYLNPQAWVQYFAAMKPQYDHWAELLKQPAGQPRAHWGALPFRVHQLFDTMVRAAKEKDQKLFLCAGGALIHYVGDACQPLHASYLSQGDPDQVVEKPRSLGKMKLQADGVHSGYEDDMIAYGTTDQDLEDKLKTRIATLRDENIAPIASGFDASKAIISLIKATQAEVAPRDIVDKWVELTGTPKKEKAKALWQAFGDRTITCMARGTRYLAAIWQAAWEVGNGDGNIGEGRKIDQSDIEALYNDPDVVPSIPLDHYPPDKSTDWSALKRSAPTNASDDPPPKALTQPAAKDKGKAKRKPKPKPARGHRDTNRAALR